MMEEVTVLCLLYAYLAVGACDTVIPEEVVLR
jgi:hypothetical protein